VTHGLHHPRVMYGSRHADSNSASLHIKSWWHPSLGNHMIQGYLQGVRNSVLP